MKKGKYLILGLFPLAISAALLQGTNSTLPKNRTSGSLQNKAEVVPDDDQNDESEGVELVYSGADPKDIIAALEQLTGRTALIGPKLSTNKISINSKEPISRLEAIEALESVLSLNDVAIVGGDDEKFFKVVSLKSALTQSPSIIDESLLEFSPSQKISSKFFKLHYLDAGEFQKSIKSILTPSTSNVILFSASNSLFITDTVANLQNVENLIKRTDTPIQMVESVNFIPLNNVKASSVVKKFDQLKRGALKKYLSTTTIDCDDSSNQLIVIAAKENLPTIENIAKQLDNKCELLLKSEVIRIKHGDAKKITGIVSGIVKEQRSRIEKENKMAFERQQAQMSAQGNMANALAQAASGSRSNQQISNTYSDFISSQQMPGEVGEEQLAQFSANLTLSADERSNSIIIYGTSSDLIQVRNLIFNLDVLLDQVRIEVIVAEVTLENDQNSGLAQLTAGYHQAQSYSPYQGSKKTIIPGGGKDGADLEISHQYEPKAYDINFKADFKNSISNFTGTLKNFALTNIFQQAKTDSNIKILSTPTLVTTHNRKANFSYGQDYPFMDSSTQSEEGSRERINIVYKRIGMDLKVTPLIGSNGIIQMEIEQEISAHTGDGTVGASSSPIISKKSINSFVSVSDGDVIVLAGFKEKTASKDSGKIFLLGDLPIIGDAFFTGRHRKETTKELIVFIKPTIILHPQDEAAYLDKKLEVTNFKEDINCYKATGDFPKGDPFPEDTILGLNGQEMRKKAEMRRKVEMERKQREEMLRREEELSSDEDSSSSSASSFEADETVLEEKDFSGAVDGDEATKKEPKNVKRTRRGFGRRR
ncbi:MAG: hypothetical protein LBI77_03995 [Puniceicoccales bacterium]|nr:hypothetical protein [Puniceicoccales bacterium]